MDGYSQELATQICEALINGKSLRSICEPENMPAASTVCLWLTKYPDFAEQYAHAREAQADTLADEITDIADDGTNDWMKRSESRGGGYELNGENVQRSRLRVDARKWIASKLKPKKYGDKIEQTHKGDATAPVPFQLIASDIPPHSKAD